MSAWNRGLSATKTSSPHPWLHAHRPMASGLRISCEDHTLFVFCSSGSRTNGIGSFEVATGTYFFLYAGSLPNSACSDEGSSFSTAACVCRQLVRVGQRRHFSVGCLPALSSRTRVKSARPPASNTHTHRTSYVEGNAAT